MARIKIAANWLDRALGYFAPARALQRVRARTHLEAVLRRRSFDAAQAGRRTSGWKRVGTDVNAENGLGMIPLRELAREVIRNNPWARSGLRTITRHVVGWGVIPEPLDVDDPARERIEAAWRRWAGTTECDADGRRTFYGLQKQAVRTAAESGEVLVRRRWRRASDGLTLPMQLQVLEPDLLDISKDGEKGLSGGKIVQGVEFDAIGRRSAYWLYDDHPGSTYRRGLTSRRIPATEIVHMFEDERPGQVRAVSWFSSIIPTLSDFDEFEGASIMRQKMAALFAAFVTGESSGDDPAGMEPEPDSPNADDDRIEEWEPGMVKYLKPGEKIEFPTMPQVQNDGFTERNLRRSSAGIGVTYEDFTGDYSRVNFSSARMARLAHWGNVYDWQWNMLIPQLCDPVWAWAMEAAQAVGLVEAIPLAEWTPPPMPMIDPDKEGLAYTRRVRAGQMTPDEMVREQGKVPRTHWKAYARALAVLDELKIWLDCDVRRVSAAGLTQERVGGGSGSSSSDGDGSGEDGQGEAGKNGEVVADSAGPPQESRPSERPPHPLHPGRPA